MKHFTLPRFWNCYNDLPKNVQLVADKNYRLLKSDPAHPSLHFKKIGGHDKQLWSVRIGLGYRALALEKSAGLYWFWIGSHSDYDRLIS